MIAASTPNRAMPLLVAFLLIGANSVTATLLTLSKVELISSLGAPLRCVIAYNTPIIGCNVQELALDNGCSAQCERALEGVQSNIQDACQDVSVPSNSLVGQAQQGNLLKVLCNKEPSRQPGSFTRIPDVKTQPPPPPPPPPPPATTSSEEKPPETMTQRITAPPEPTSTSEEPPTTTEASTTTSEKKRPPITTSIVPSGVSESESVKSSTSSSSEDPKAPLRIGGGGGSPFDPPPDSLASSGQRLASSIVMVVAVYAGILVFQF